MGKQAKNSGFTIVELLIVVIVIAILAAITVVGFNGISNRAHEAGVQSDTRNGSMALESYRLNNGLTGGACPASVVKASEGNTLSCEIASNGVDFCVNVVYGDYSYYAIQSNLTPAKGFCSGFEAVPAGTEAVSVSSRGIGLTCALYGGDVYCWGYGTSGELGNGADANSSIPVAVSKAGALAGKTVKLVASGSAATSCAVTTDNGIYCWGNNGNGTLGNGTTDDSNVPVAVDMSGVLSGKTVTDIQVGIAHVCALASGQLYCWGYNTSGSPGGWSNFGTLTPASSSTPVAVQATGVLAGKTIIDFELDGYGGPNCVVTSENEIYCWGYGATGGLGDGARVNSHTPVAVDMTGVLAGKTVTDISTYEYHACAVASGQAYCWGGNGSSQLGDGTIVDKNTPVAVSTAGVMSGKTIVSVSAGDYYSCALDDQGQVYCWGDDYYGTLGYSAAALDSSVPVAVSTSGVLAGKQVTELSAGYAHVCVVASYRVYCWGQNWGGSLGNGSTARSGLPVSVTK